MPRRPLQDLLVELRGELVGFLHKEAGPVLRRFETAEDLYQGVASKALEAQNRFEYRTPGEARAWLYRIARNHIADRYKHWLALKRRSGQVLRFELSHSAEGGAPEPRASQTGPSTFALRREQLVLATRALSMLLDRDRELVQWNAEGIPLSEQAERAGMNYHALAQASRRALERFRKIFDLVARRQA